jgi:hypothetical protein
MSSSSLAYTLAALSVNLKSMLVLLEGLFSDRFGVAPKSSALGGQSKDGRREGRKETRNKQNART